MKEVGRGRFRQDLYYRVAIAILRIPPLRERQGDVTFLIDKLLQVITREGNDLGLEQKDLSPAAKNLLLRYDWPGNVRELQSALLRAAVWSTGPTIRPDDIRAALSEPLENETRDILNQPLGNGFRLEDLVSDVAREYLRRAYDHAHGKKVEAAGLLGFSNYQTFSNWMKKYGVDGGT